MDQFIIEDNYILNKAYQFNNYLVETRGGGIER